MLQPKISTADEIMARRAKKWEESVIDQLVKDGKIVTDHEGRLRMAVYVVAGDGYRLEVVPLTAKIVDQIEKEGRYV